MKADKMFYEHVFPSVLANEATCRVFLSELEKRGIKPNIPYSQLTHEECINVATHIVLELRRREMAEAPKQ